ncbi:MAG TPA: hypothetical protein VK929_16855 [Longimicrobiales bacterium]|nr:hypothetical protein [Longimicrobiales bacterium]
MRLLRNSFLATLALVTAAACADMDVDNPNAPGRDQVGGSAADLEALIAGAMQQVVLTHTEVDGPAPMLSTMSFQHSAYPANFGMVYYSAIPRRAFNNDVAREFYNQVANAWTWSYRGAAGVANALHAFQTTDMSLGDDEPRARAWGNFMLGMTHGSIALLFDQGPVVNQATPRDDNDLPAPDGTLDYNALMAVALAHFDSAIAIASANTFTVPEAWAMSGVTNTQLVGIAHAVKAQFRAMNARTWEERQAVNWNAVLADLDNATEWNLAWNWPTWTNWAFVYSTFAGWGQENLFIMGMADQSGNYQEWLSRPVLERTPQAADGRDLLIVTPDLRFPRGNTLAEQQAAANRGTHIWAAANPGDQWARPDRGSWRWSHYQWRRYGAGTPNAGYGDLGPLPFVSNDHLRLLEAEAHFHLGDRAQAAALINVTRTAAGLNATDAAGTNTSCVPKLPDGSCGGLFEMLKWEKRLMTKFEGPYTAPWYFDGRGWGDLYRGTPLHFPMPAREASLEGVAPYTFGGALPGSAPQSVYAWPE